MSAQTVDKARAGESVAMKIEGGTTDEKSRMFGRHFDHNHQLVRMVLEGANEGVVVKANSRTSVGAC